MIPIDQLVPHEKNPRKISEVDMEALKTSITNFQKMMKLKPMVAEKYKGKLRILAGCQRLQALIQLGYTEIPEEWLLITPKLTPAERQEFMIKDNTHYGTWDWEVLSVDWTDAKLGEWGVDVPEFGFKPNLSPSTGVLGVTGTDIQTAKDRLAGEHDKVSTQVSVCCPACAHEFFINK